MEAMLKGPLYILLEEYRSRRQTFQSDVGIRCGSIGLSKISQGAPTRPQTAECFALDRRGSVVTRRIYSDKVSRCRTHSAKLLTFLRNFPSPYQYANINL